MIKSPAFQLYPQDFISSLDVQMMTAAEVGAYCLLLFNAWLSDEQGYLPNDEKILQFISRLSDEEWEKSKDVILKKFSVDETTDRLFHERLVAERNKQQLNSQKRSAAGRESAKARRSKGENQEKTLENTSFAETNTCLTDVQPALNPSSPKQTEKQEKEKIDSDKEQLIEKEFHETIWPAYKRKEGKQEALKKYVKRRRKASFQEISQALNRFVSSQKAKNIEIAYWPHLSTWLNQSRDKDDFNEIESSENGYSKELKQQQKPPAARGQEEFKPPPKLTKEEREKSRIARENAMKRLEILKKEKLLKKTPLPEKCLI